MSSKGKKKRLKDEDIDWEGSKRKKNTDESGMSSNLGNCVIHMENSNMKAFKYFDMDNSTMLTKFKDIATRHLKEDASSSYRMETVCNNVLGYEKLTDKDGYHRDCYQKYVMVLPHN